MRVDAIGMFVVGGGLDAALTGGGRVVPPGAFEVAVGSPVMPMLFELSDVEPAVGPAGVRCAIFESVEHATPKRQTNTSGAWNIDIDRLLSFMKG